MTLMDMIFFATLVCMVLALATITRILGGNKKKHLNLPPGKMGGWPLVGEFFRYTSPMPSTSLGSYVEEKVKRYGKIFKINLFGSPVIISTDEEFNRFVLQDEGKCSELFFPKAFDEILGKTSKEMVFGEKRRPVKILMNHFLAIPSLQSHFLRTFQTHVLQALQSWKQGVHFSAQHQLEKLSFSTIMNNMLSLEPGERDTEELWRLYVYLGKGLSSLPLNAPGTTYSKALKSRRAITKIIERIMEERIDMKKREEEDVQVRDSDYLDTILESMDLPQEYTIDHMLALLLAGYETSATTMTMAMHFLAGCPRAIQHLKEEHVEIQRRKREKGESYLTWEDVKFMEFTCCVIKETLRLGNITRELYRKVTADFRYNGYDIPCGSTIFLNLAAARLDPELFEEPHRFNPWRWQSVDENSKLSKNYLPFGEGMHKCSGQHLLKMEASIFLHYLVLNYEWEMVVPADPTFQYNMHRFSDGLLIKVKAV